MGTQAAGRQFTKVHVPQYAAPWSTVRTYRGDAGGSLVQRPHHLTTCRSEVCLSLCLSAPVFLWLTTKGHAKLLHYCCTPTIQAPRAFTFTCMAVGLQEKQQ
jgi:hypothetical protein